jgi:hypothetical protein
MFQLLFFGHHQVTSTLSAIPLSLVNFAMGGMSYCCFQCRFLVLDLNKYCKLYCGIFAQSKNCGATETAVAKQLLVRL